MIRNQMSRWRDNLNCEDVPYMPGMGWRIMDVIDPENELNHFLDAIEMMDGMDDMKDRHGGK